MIYIVMIMRYSNIELPKGVTRGQFELLVLITPEPSGQGLTQRKAAEKLRITPGAVQKRLANFKRNCPEFYANYKTIVKKAQIFRENLEAVEAESNHPIPRLEGLGYYQRGIHPQYVDKNAEYMAKYGDTISHRFEDYEKDFVGYKKDFSYYISNRIMRKF